MKEPKKTIFDRSQQGQHAYSLPKDDEAFQQFLPLLDQCRKEAPPLPEVAELDVMRHYSLLAKQNMGIDTNFYPLGSCTMKFNPRLNELVAAMPGFARTHPFADPSTVQGNLEVMSELVRILCEVSGMYAGTLCPNAGAQGEFTGMRMIADYHRRRGHHHRKQVLVPDNAHGTNPATAIMAGLEIVPIRTNDVGDMDLDHLREVVSENTAGLMLTNPNTLGVFSPKIQEIAAILHEHDALLYYDGANLNAIMNIARPGEMGFDVMHINLHKTFSTPHGGGGPGAGPVLCSERLADFLPTPRVVAAEEGYDIDWDCPDSIGQIASFQGNFAVCLRAYVYILCHGHAGMRRISENAVLNANYLKHKLAKFFTVPFPQHCMHEFVLQADNYLDQEVKALDIAKRLLDYGVHAPTIYFPLIIRECMLIEPTETESKVTLDRFVEIMELIVQEIHEDPETVRTAPHSYPVTRLDEVLAARQPCLKHESC